MAFLREGACCAWITVGVLCVASAARSETPDAPSGGLTLAHAIAAVLASNPELRVGELELRAGEGRMLQAGLRPNPELALELENFAGSGETSGTKALETTLTLSQVIELGGKRASRHQVATRGYERLAAERRIRQLDVLAEVTRRYLEVVLAQERVALSQTAFDLADRNFSVMARRVEAARSPKADQTRASIARTRSRLHRARVKQDLDTARIRLAAMWGEGRAGFTSAVADLYSLPPVDPIGALDLRLSQSPEFLQYAALQRLREAELELARARARPSLKLTAGLRWLEENDDTALVLGVSLPLPVFDSRQGQRAESLSRIAKTEAERSAALVEARMTLASLHGELRVATDEVETLRGELLPQAQRALHQTRSGFERGRFSYLDLATAQQDLLDMERAAIEAAGAVHRLHTEIERLTGEPLGASVPTR